MSGKKFINDPATVVDEALEGLVLAHPGLKLLKTHRVIYRADIEAIRSSEVTILSGGGSGHEPSHVGFVGPSMLTAAVCGGVFASPSASQIEAALDHIGGPKGTLVIIKNYTGDKLNFAKAVERFRRRHHFPVEMVVVAEDCAIDKDQVGGAGRRGLSGTILVHKIAGAAASEGLPLEEVARRARYVSDNIVTIGVALSPCSLPGLPPSFTLPADQMELGLGIHGEAGARRITLLSAAETTALCLDVAFGEGGYLDFDPNDSNVVLLVNNLGGMTGLELSILVKEAFRYISKRWNDKSQPVRLYSGALMTSLEMSGCSFTILRVPKQSDELNWILESLDRPVGAFGWPKVVEVTQTSPDVGDSKVSTSETLDTNNYPIETRAARSFAAAIVAASDAILKAEAQLGEYDRITGDGDCGNTLASGAKALKAAVEIVDGQPRSGKGIDFERAADACGTIARIMEDSMGGTSGALYSLFFETAATQLDISVNWTDALKVAADALQKHGGASVGDRTLIDALAPGIAALSSGGMKDSAQAARDGADSTGKMPKAKFGRTSYVGESAGIIGVPDPGAVAVAIIFEAVSSVFA
ncbi:bifunctional ATP-dependent dihydroxyacetone kinase/FAD-AMP lyase-like protein [Cladochytrium replicatum]|nr:bifunctional ATP-dependent dihydroxyacetone kinase/FAD-AMP lyase-like protein [Cladochytrium replicatum]